jgi:hypothetical protein
MDPIFDAVQRNLDSALSVPFVSSSVVLGLAFYAYKAAPELPSFLEELFLNVFFQIFVGFMVLYMGTRDFMLSLVVSVVFVYGMKMLSGLKEGMFGGVKIPGLSLPTGRPPTIPISGPVPGPAPSTPSTPSLEEINKNVGNKIIDAFKLLGIDLPKNVDPLMVADKPRRKYILDDARSTKITSDEKTAFKNILLAIPNQYYVIDDLLNVFKYGDNIRNFMCGPLFGTLKKGVIYPSNKEAMTPQTMKLLGTDKDWDDAKKIRLARLFEDYINNQPKSIDDSQNIFNNIYMVFDTLIINKLPNINDIKKREYISGEYKKILNDYNEKVKKGIELEECRWYSYDYTIL